MRWIILLIHPKVIETFSEWANEVHSNSLCMILWSASRHSHPSVRHLSAAKTSPLKLGQRESRHDVRSLRWTSFLFWGVGQSATFTGSISAILCEMMNSRYSTQVCLNLHFSGLRKSWCWQRCSRTRCIMQQCSSKVFVKMRILLRYTHTTPSMMRSWKMSFIMVWNIARLLVRPKNMTRSLNNSWLVQDAAFHSSPSLIHTLL